MSRPRVLLLVGYFDWFSGYQETGLAAWLSRYATTEVVAGNRVSSIFSDTHLAGLGIPRVYPTGTIEEKGVRVTRFPTVEKRSMVWSTKARAYIESQEYDLIIQVMPGQLLPLAGTLARNRAVRVVLYGDNSAMWSHLSGARRFVKGAIFALSKGLLYAIVNRKADFVYGYTPDTLQRLRRYGGGKRIHVLPLAFDSERFYFDEQIRERARAALGYKDTDRVVIAAGKLQPKKRLDLLLDAFERLAVDRDGARLLVVGVDDSQYSVEFLERVQSDPFLQERVTLRRFVISSELNELFNAADVGVWPRMPAITIQQAMGTGLPVVLPKNEWVGHLILPGSGAYFDGSVDGGSRAIELAIAGQLSGGVKSPERRERAGSNAWLSSEGLVISLLRAAGFNPVLAKGDCDSVVDERGGKGRGPDA